MSGKRAKTLRKSARSTADTPTAAAVDVQSTAANGRKSSAKPAVENPRQELAPVGPHPTLAGRDARGRFAADNDGHTSTGVSSQKRWNALAPMLRDERVRVLADKGHTEADAAVVMT